MSKISVFKLITIGATAATLLAIATPSEAAPNVRDHRHPSQPEIVAPPGVDQDSSKPNRRPGGVSVSPKVNKLRIYSKTKSGKPIYRRCDVRGDC